MLEEINTKTEINVNCEKIRESKTVVAFRFRFDRKNPIIKKPHKQTKDKPVKRNNSFTSTSELMSTNSIIEENKKRLMQSPNHREIA